MEKDITLDLHVVEDETETKVTAVLDLRGDHFEAEGSARRNPVDPPVPVIGEELEARRASVAEIGEEAHRTAVGPDGRRPVRRAGDLEEGRVAFRIEDQVVEIDHGVELVGFEDGARAVLFLCYTLPWRVFLHGRSLIIHGFFEPS